MKKGELSRQRLLDGLLFCLSEYGVEATTFQKVADHCGVSQGLVVKTFKNRDNLLWSAFAAMLTQARESTESALAAEKTATEKLSEYIRVSIEIFTRRKETSRLYLLLYYLSSHDQKYLLFHTQLKEMAVSRIKSILDLGTSGGEFSPCDTEQVAKTLHSSLTGLLMNSVTEKSDYQIEALGRVLLQQFMARLLAGGPRSFQ